MKHGISLQLVDTHNQLPNRNRRECKYYWDELYTLVAAGGFHEIETPYDPLWAFGGRSGVPLVYPNILYKDGSAQNYLRRLNEAGIERVLGVHYMPGMFFNGVSPIQGGADLSSFVGAMIHFGQEAVDYVADIGGDYVTASVSPKIGEVEALYGDFAAGRDEVLKAVAGAVETLAAHANAKGVKFCLKNEFWSLFRGEAIVDFVKGLREKVWLDVDTAELAIAGVDPVAFVRDNAALIGVVHYSDTKFEDDQDCYRQRNPEFPSVRATKVYRDLGDGALDFPALESALKALGYDGPLVIGCRNSYDVCRSILRARSYLNMKLPEC